VAQQIPAGRYCGAADLYQNEFVILIISLLRIRLVFLDGNYKICMIFGAAQQILIKMNSPLLPLFCIRTITCDVSGNF